jgi:hypothetical protein
MPLCKILEEVAFLGLCFNWSGSKAILISQKFNNQTMVP